MLKNYFKIALRNILKHKAFSLINITGLAIGIAASSMMFLIVFHETSYDQHINEKEKIGRVLVKSDTFNHTREVTSALLAPKLKESIPEVTEAARAWWIWAKFSKDGITSKREMAYCVDPNLVEMLSIRISYGSNLINKNSVLLSKSTAEKYFGSNNAVGEVVFFKIMKKEYSFNVVGVFDNIPETSTLNSNILFSMDLGEDIINEMYGVEGTLAWRMDIVFTYFKLDNENNFSSLDKKLDELSKSVFPEGYKSTMSSQKLDDIYFGSNHLLRSRFQLGDKLKTTIFTIIAILILIIASLNFIILSSAKSIKRYKEIGVRKIIGATRHSLILQITIESIIIALVSLPFSLILIEISIVELSQILNINVSAQFYKTSSFYFWVSSYTIFIGAVSGTCVAIFLTKFNVVDILQQKINRNQSGIKTRNIFVTAQLIITMGLIFSIVVIHNQISFFRTTDMGFKKDNLFIIKSSDKNFVENYNVLKHELLKIPNVLNISAASELPPQFNKRLRQIGKNNNPDEKIGMHSFGVTYDFIKTMGMELVEGRDFSIDFPSDFRKTYILNETAVKELELGKDRIIHQSGTKIIGIVKDFNFKSLQTKITPLYMTLDKNKFLAEIVFQIYSENRIATVEEIKKTFQDISPQTKYSSYFYDEMIENHYTKEINFFTIFNIFTGLAILVTCLGLFGLTLFIIEQRKKEIGIRKVLGASVFRIVKMISQEFIFLILFGIVIASPIAYYFMNNWLQNFAYRIEISFPHFLLAGLIVLLLVGITVSWQSIKAAVANPVDSLRDE
jgi:putative ABC transport system permease protein